MLLSTYLLGKLPEGAVKRWVNKMAYIIAFRIIARSCIGIINFHNKQYRPANASVCVANHTTPIDVVLLSTDNNYSLVSRGESQSRLNVAKNTSMLPSSIAFVSVLLFLLLSGMFSAFLGLEIPFGVISMCNLWTEPSCVESHFVHIQWRFN